MTSAIRTAVEDQDPNVSKRVALMVDNPYRDLPGLVLVATRLCHEGVACYLVPFNLQGSEIWSLAPDFVLLNYLRTNNEGYARQLAESAIRLGILDTEGGVLASLDTYGQWLAQDQQVRAGVACYCSWGRRLADYAVRSGWFASEQITVTGSPRLDFYAKPWRQVALQALTSAVLCERDLILVNGNFTVSNPRFQSPEVEARTLVEHFGYDLGFVLEWQRTEKRTMHELTALTNRLARRFPQATFVYRPHPFERTETYEPILEKRENLHLVKAGTVEGWILRARAVIQRSCSTAIEAGVAGVPALLPAWIPTAVHMPASDEVSVQCETEEELLRVLESILTGDFERPAYIQRRLDEVIGEWFYRVDGQAYKRVADCILRSLATSGQVQLHKCRRLAYRRNATTLKWKAHAALASALGLSVHWSFQRWGPVLADLSGWDNSEKYFDAKQVRALVEAIQACAKDGSEELRKITIQPAQEHGDYHFGYLQGRAVAVFPEWDERGRG